MEKILSVHKCELYMSNSLHDNETRGQRSGPWAQRFPVSSLCQAKISTQLTKQSRVWLTLHKGPSDPGTQRKTESLSQEKGRDFIQQTVYDGAKKEPKFLF